MEINSAFLSSVSVPEVTGCACSQSPLWLFICVFIFIYSIFSLFHPCCPCKSSFCFFFPFNPIHPSLHPSPTLLPQFFQRQHPSQYSRLYCNMHYEPKVFFFPCAFTYIFHNTRSPTNILNNSLGSSAHFHKHAQS